MKTYHIKRMPTERVKLFCQTDPQTPEIEVLKSISFVIEPFAPNFAYGHRGKGAGKLAFSVLKDCLGESVALEFYEAFQFKYITPQSGNQNEFFITEEVIRKWVDEETERRKAEEEEENAPPVPKPPPTPKPPKPTGGKFKVGDKVTVKSTAAHDWVRGEWGVVSEVNGLFYKVKPLGIELHENELERYEDEFSEGVEE